MGWYFEKNVEEAKLTDFNTLRIFELLVDGQTEKWKNSCLRRKGRGLMPNPKGGGFTALPIAVRFALLTAFTDTRFKTIGQIRAHLALQKMSSRIRSSSATEIFLFKRTCYRKITGMLFRWESPSKKAVGCRFAKCLWWPTFLMHGEWAFRVENELQHCFGSEKKVAREVLDLISAQVGKRKNGKKVKRRPIRGVSFRKRLPHIGSHPKELSFVTARSPYS